jgi:hypothetical protein
MAERVPQLSLEDLARLVGGDVGEKLQQRLAAVLRTDARFDGLFATLDRLAAEAGTDDLLQAYVRHREFERLLTARRRWKDPAEVLDPGGRGLYLVDYRQLLAIAEARLQSAEDPEAMRELRDRLLEAEKKSAGQAVFAVAEALEYLSERAADQVLAEVREKSWRRPGDSGGG